LDNIITIIIIISSSSSIYLPRKGMTKYGELDDEGGQ